MPFGYRFISGSVCFAVVTVLFAFWLIILNVVYKVTEMEAVLKQHNTAMPGRDTLEALADKFR